MSMFSLATWGTDSTLWHVAPPSLGFPLCPVLSLGTDQLSCVPLLQKRLQTHSISKNVSGVIYYGHSSRQPGWLLHSFYCFSSSWLRKLFTSNYSILVAVSEGECSHHRQPPGCVFSSLYYLITRLSFPVLKNNGFPMSSRTKWTHGLSALLIITSYLFTYSALES